VAGQDRSLVAHLFRRAAFGAKPEELAYYTRAGYATAVDDLLSGKPLMGQRPSTDELLDPVNRPVQNLRGRAVVAGLNEIQTTWLRRMVTSTTPLVERMTLFLHDHWATAYRPGDNIDTPELQAQNDLFRSSVFASWRALCHSMIEDVALSCWLDNNVNHKDHPNENLAREFMELFTLGPGNYTERDVREAARALTGYELAYNLSATGPRNHMVFNAANHDNGTDDDPPRPAMTILGETGNFMPGDFVDIALRQPAAPRFLARKLIETFVMPNPGASFVDRIAGTLRRSGWKLRPALRQIFLSPEFRSPAARTSVVKSPAEFVAGALRSLGRTSNDDLQVGLYWMTQAGQTLYDPPNVGGWPTNEGWLGAGGVLARYNAAVGLADRHVASSPLLPTQHRVRATSPSGWGAIFGITDLARGTRAALDGYLRDATDTSDTAVDAAMITLVVASPDFSLA
jgi:uncharacterized protein (DUF1800 family)